MKTLYKAALAVTALALVGCTAPGLAASLLPAAPGFWQGLWHGMIFPVTFFISLFNHEVGMYAAVNSGGWYNFGFFVGVAMSMGGSGGAARSAGKKKEG